MMKIIPIRVECYSGYRAEELPRVLCLGDERLEVEEVVDRWYQSGLDPAAGRAEYFKLRAGAQLYVVKRDSATHAWYLVAELPVRQRLL